MALILWTGYCDASKIKVIVGYRAQKRILQERAVRGGWDMASITNGVELSTVHAAQGRESHVVLNCGDDPNGAKYSHKPSWSVPAYSM